MDHNRLRTFIIACGLLITGSAVQSPTLAQGGGGTREQPVVVTNTTANPVPVAGGVSITNTPTVKLDPNENIVRIGRSTTVLLLTETFLIPNGTHTPELMIDTAEYETIRVCTSFSIGAPANVSINTLSTEATGFVTRHRLDSFTAPENSGSTGVLSSGVCRAFVAPGTRMSIQVRNVQGSVGIAVWGR
jgi:hypothetical protein